MGAFAPSRVKVCCIHLFIYISNEFELLQALIEVQLHRSLEGSGVFCSQQHGRICQLYGYNIAIVTFMQRKEGSAIADEKQKLSVEHKMRPL